MPTGPLSALTVLDLGQIYLGPYCGMLMARLGATVIKIEPPGGEAVRFRRAEGEPAVAFDLLNAGKRGISLDLKQADGRALFMQLVEGTDVVIENFGPGTLERLGVGYEALAAVNPKIVVGSGSGYGSYGPYRDYKAMDLTVQAMTGILAATGFPENPPVKSGPAVADFGGGIHLLAGILAALVERGTTGRGQHVEVAMQDALIPMLSSNFAGYLESAGLAPERTGNRHGGLGVCPYNVYPTSNGWIAILGITDRHWAAMTATMQRQDLAEDVDLASNSGRVKRMDEVDGHIKAWTLTQTTAEALTKVRQADVPCAPVVGVAELFSDPHVHERKVLRTIRIDGSDRWILGSPIKMGNAADEADPSAPPRLGEHTDEVLVEQLGLTVTELSRLHELGVI